MGNIDREQRWAYCLVRTRERAKTRRKVKRWIKTFAGGTLELSALAGAVAAGYVFITLAIVVAL